MFCVLPVDGHIKWQKYATIGIDKNKVGLLC